MAQRNSGADRAEEGYVYNSYGDAKYLKFAVASVTTLRRYDSKRPVAIYCTEEHATLLETPELRNTFNHVYILPEENRSITGFKHNVDQFMPFDRNIYLDGDIVACKDPENLWRSFSGYGFTITGNQSADNFFGGPKGVGIIRDIVLGRRKRTLRRFGLTYLPRVQSGLMFASDKEITKKVSRKATEILENKSETHFRSRTEEAGRSEESCEWSLAMAMATLEVPVAPWFNGHESPQLDFIDLFTTYDPDFKEVQCLYFTNPFVYNFRGFPVRWVQQTLIKLFSLFPGKGDYMNVKPYFLHFGWYHQKEPFYQFADRVWKEIGIRDEGPIAQK